MYAYQLFNVDFWSNDEQCWRYETVTGTQLQSILNNPSNERITYREIKY